MNILIEKSFDKDMDRINKKNIKRDVAKIIEKIMEAENLFDVPTCSKMKGYKHAYKIRLGDYRIGISYESRTVVFMRILHRKKIYKKFP